MFKDINKPSDASEVYTDDLGHLVQFRQAVNQPQQQHNQPMYDVVIGPNGQPEVAQDVLQDIPPLEDLLGIILQPDVLEQTPILGEQQAGQQDQWVSRSTRPTKQPDKYKDFIMLSESIIRTSPCTE